MADQHFEVCQPSVVGEVIDGEAIIMDLRSGAYYSADGVGAIIWDGLSRGASKDQILTWAANTFPDQPRGAADAEAFLLALLARELIREIKVPAGQVVELLGLTGGYKIPNLMVHEDMQDLITLDPIHDVDEVGWPTRKAEAK